MDGRDHPQASFNTLFVSMNAEQQKMECDSQPNTTCCSSNKKPATQQTACTSSCASEASPCCASDGVKKNSCCSQSEAITNQSPCCQGKESMQGKCCKAKQKTDNGTKAKEAAFSCCAAQTLPKGCCHPSSLSSDCCGSKETTGGPSETGCYSTKQTSCCRGPNNETDGQCSAPDCFYNSTFAEDAFMLPHNTKSFTGRSELFVNHLCCASEVPVIHSILDGTPGIEKIAVNPVTKTVYVNHEPDILSSKEIAALLNKQGMGAEVRVDAADTMTSHQLSLFVVSKFRFDDVNVNQDRLDIVLRNFGGTKVESFVYEDRSGILTVIHNPWTIDTKEISEAMRHAGVETVDVLLNGSNQNRAPLDFASLAASNASRVEENESSHGSSKWPKPNIIVSGVLWIVSMLSFIGDKWEPLKYVALVSVSFGLPPIARKAIGTLRQQFKFDANGLMLLASLGALALGEFPEAGKYPFSNCITSCYALMAFVLVFRCRCLSFLAFRVARRESQLACASSTLGYCTSPSPNSKTH